MRTRCGMIEINDGTILILHFCPLKKKERETSAQACEGERRKMEGRGGKGGVGHTFRRHNDQSFTVLSLTIDIHSSSRRSNRERR